MPLTRREFIGRAALLAVSTQFPRAAAPAEPIIDIHQHTNYHGRSDADLLKHQRAMGVTHTVLLPAGKYYGLDAQCGGNDSVTKMREQFPSEFITFANEMPYERDAIQVVTKYLKGGAKGIGEQKFRVLADSAYVERLAEVAKEFGVPMLLHFQDGDYNMELRRFRKILEKFPTVNFIGHAQTWWANIDKRYEGKSLYPKGPVTAGGLTDEMLREHPNMYGDLSAGSGLNALTRDEQHTRGFFERHQSKLMFGSDCQDAEGQGSKCVGAQILAAVRKLSPTKAIERKLLYENAKRVLKL